DPVGHGPLDGARKIDLGDGGRLFADPDRVPVGLDLVVRPAGPDTLGMVLRVPARDRGRVALLDQEPLLALVLERGGRRAARPAARPDDREPALHLLAGQHELQLAVGDRGGGIGRLRLRRPGSPIPDDDVAGAVLAVWDHALEVEVLDRVILDVDGHPADRRIEGRALRDGPADEDPVDLEPEVVVEPGRAVALDDEPTRTADGRVAGRLGRLAEVALALVGLERHRRSVWRIARRGAAAGGSPAGSEVR